MPENKRPSVFPTAEQMAEANKTGEEIRRLMAEKNGEQPVNLSEGEAAAIDAMRRITDEQLEFKEKTNSIPFVHRPELAEGNKFTSEIKYGNEANTEAPKPVQPKVSNPVVNTDINTIKSTISELEDKYERLSIPQDNVPFDVIPLPSGGKLYPNKKPNMKVAYLNASDENILTNPNLLESGRFLEILINRKMLDTNIRYKDLHVGDRNAIMIWLRSTAYGPMYPISLYDPATGNPFETDIDLNQLKVIPLSIDTDRNGFIDFILPISKAEIKFKLLTVGDIDDIEEHTTKIIEEQGAEFVDTVTYTLKKHLMMVNGRTDREYIDDFADKMIIGDVKALRKFINEIESGMDMNLTVTTPGGESIRTFLPLNVSFFWPDLHV